MQKQFKTTLCVAFILLLSISGNAQTGLNFQGVARTSNNVILASQQISLRLSILQGSASGNTEYLEIRKVTTNPQGLFTAVIGDADATSTVGSFSSINWKNTPKYLKVEMDPTAGNNFTTMGTTQFQYVAYAQYASSVDAENIIGMIPVSKGGTGVSSIVGLKTALAIDKTSMGLSNVDNTTDLSKPISTATQTALDTKANTTNVNAALLLKANTTEVTNALSLKSNTTDVTTSLLLKENITNKSTANDLGGIAPSDILYPSQKAVKEYILANTASGGVADGGITNIKLADGSVTYSKFQSIPANTILGNSSSSNNLVQAIATTGSDNVVLSNSPTISSPILLTPDIGNATATSLNNISFLASGSQTASLTVIGAATVKRVNNGDDAINLRYENLLTDGIVSLTSDQPISGQKTFFNDLIMGNIGGIGSLTPTTINFANGSKVGDIQDIHDGQPDTGGSIDLFAPLDARWVQLNYANTNYVTVDANGAYIYVGNNVWGFNSNGTTSFPDNKIVNANGANMELAYEFSHGQDYFYSGMNFEPQGANLELNINSPTSNTFKDWNWYYNLDGTTEFPGSLNLIDESYINFIGDPNLAANASLSTSGPFLKIQTRSLTEQESDDEVNSGIELNYTDQNILTVGSNGVKFKLNNSAGEIAYNSNEVIFLLDNQHGGNNQWNFRGSDAQTSLPGDLIVNGRLIASDIVYPTSRGTVGQVLTMSTDGYTEWNTINLPYASTNSSGLLNSSDYIRFNNKQDAMDYATSSTGGYLRSVDFNIFNGKQDALTNPLIGTGANGQISFFNGTNTVTSSSDLFWNASNKKLGIGTSNPGYPLEVNQGVSNEYGLMLTAPKENSNGSTIGFSSNIGSGTKNGLFQLDGDGAMVFRTLQNDMYFDNFGNGSVNFRVGVLNGNTDSHGNPDHDVFTRMRLDNSGNLTVSNNISTGTLSVTGDISVIGAVTASNISSSSDLRLKQNILPLQNALSIIENLNPVSYEKKKTLESNIYSIIENGFIAQELQKILPELVFESTDKDKLLSVNYTAIIPILTKGIQEQQALIETLKKEMGMLKKIIQKSKI